MKIKIVIILVLSILLVIFSQNKYDKNTDLFFGKNKHLMIPTAKTLKIVSFGNVNLIADLIYIWAIQFFATESIKNRFDYAVQIFNIITDLNPRFEPPYDIGSTIIGLNAKKPKKAIELLQKGKIHIKDNYFFDYDSGYFAWFYLKDYKLAKKYYKELSKYESLPDILKEFWINMDIKIVDKVADQKKAFEIWKEIEKNVTWKSKKESATAHLLQIKYNLDKVEIDKLILIFKQLYNRVPYSLKELKNRLKVKTIPIDYIGNEYKYDPNNGKIILEMEETWKKFL